MLKMLEFLKCAVYAALSLADGAADPSSHPHTDGKPAGPCPIRREL